MKINQNSGQDDWNFSLAVYSRPGVETACLTLQNTIGLDVNVLLVGLFWAGHWQRTLKPEHLHAADAQIKPWRQNIVEPLRTLRTTLKSGPPPAPNPNTEALRQIIKNTELQSEQIAQQTLSAWFNQLNLSVGTEPIAKAMEDTAMNVVDYYLDKTKATIDSSQNISAKSQKNSTSAQLASSKPDNENIRAAAQTIAREASITYQSNTA